MSCDWKTIVCRHSASASTTEDGWLIPPLLQKKKSSFVAKSKPLKWLIEAIQQRRSTVLKVSQEIVDYQKRFLDDGPEFIEPLMKMQADR